MEVQRGNVAGVVYFEGFGERITIGTTTTGEDIWRGAATTVPTPPDAGERMSIVSTSAADNGTSATGILTMRVFYLDAAGDEQNALITIDGQTTVHTVATDIRFVQYFRAETVGPNGVAEGDIIIHKFGDAATIYGFVEAGGNMMLSTLRMVPRAKTLYLQKWHASEARGKRVACRLRTTSDSGTLLPGVFIFRDASFLNSGASPEMVACAPIPALAIVKITGWATVSGADVSSHWWGYLVDD